MKEGKTYADVLWKLRKDVLIEASKATVVRARTVQKGDLLIVLDKVSNIEGFKPEVKRVVVGLGDVRPDSKKVTLEICDLRDEGRAKKDPAN